MDSTVSEAKLLQDGTAHLQRDIESLVINIEREELASLTERLAGLISSPVGTLAKRIACQQRVAQAVQYYNVTQPDRVAALRQRLHNYDARIAAARLTDEVVRQRHPGLALRSNLAGALKGAPLMALSLYGWANGFAPRWIARAARPLGVHRLKVSSPEGNVGEILRTKEALIGTVAGWVSAAIAFPIQIYLVYGWLKAQWGAYLALPIAVLYAFSLVPSWQFYVRRRDTFRKQLSNILAAGKFLLRGGRAIRLRSRRRRLQHGTRMLLSEDESKELKGLGKEQRQ
jgi:chorismate mutase